MRFWQLVLLCCICSPGCSQPGRELPSDETVKNRFLDQREDYEKLVSLLFKDASHRVDYLADSGQLILQLNAEIDWQRRNDYQQLMTNLELESVSSMLEESETGEVLFLFKDSRKFHELGGQISVVQKGLAFHKTPPIKTVASLDTFDMEDNSDGSRRYAALAENWYIFVDFAEDEGD